jgi:hypothetical protein
MRPGSSVRAPGNGAHFLGTLRRTLTTALLVWATLGILTPAVRAPAHHAARWTTYSRITAYTQSGITASGEATVEGYTAACSYDIPLQAVIVLPDGQTRVCTDRGQLGNGSGSSWVDIYTVGDWTWVPATYGDYALVTVVS